MSNRNKGGQEGNTNSSSDNRAWGRALRRKVAQNPEALDAVACSLFAEAMDGNIQAIKELGDRLDGKAVAVIEATVTTHEASIEDLD